MSDEFRTQLCMNVEISSDKLNVTQKKVKAATTKGKLKKQKELF